MTVATYSNVNASSGYVLKTIDMTPYVGKSVTVKLTGREARSRSVTFVTSRRQFHHLYKIAAQDEVSLFETPSEILRKSSTCCELTDW